MKEYKKNCYFCHNLGSDGGDDYGNGDFPVCEAMPGRDNLKSFPFKKEQKCHVPDYWKIMEVDKEIAELFNKEDHESDYWSDSESWKLFKEKYQANRTTS